MNSKVQKPKLGIGIPTYNRADTIDFFLNVHVERLKKLNIPIYFSNNASTDETLKVLKKWKSVYSNIHWTILSETVHADINVQNVIEFSDCEYVWVLGDSYEIPYETLEFAFSFLECESPDIILVNLANKSRDVGVVSYNDCLKVVYDISYLITCLACLIFKKDEIDFKLMKKYNQSDFGHFGYTLDFISSRKFQLIFLSNVNVVTLKTPKRKVGWSANYFSIIFDKFPAVVFSLPETYCKEDKLTIIRSFLTNSGLLIWRNIINVRASNNLDSATIGLYRDKIKNYAPKKTIILMEFLKFTPSCLCKVTLTIVESIRRYKFKLMSLISRVR